MYKRVVFLMVMFCLMSFNVNAQTGWDLYGELESGIADDDTFLIIDRSDTSMHTSGTQKRYEWLTLKTDLGLLSCTPASGDCGFEVAPNTLAVGSWPAPTTATDAGLRADDDGMWYYYDLSLVTPAWTKLTSVSDTSDALNISGQTGLLTFTGLASTNRAKTVRDAADTIVEQGGNYTPTGEWTWTSATVTWPTFNQNTSGSAGSLSSTLAVASGGTGQTTEQVAINALTGVSGATNEHVLTKDTDTGNAIWKAAAGGGDGTWGSITGTLSDQTDLQGALDLKAPLASPALTGNPTAPTQTQGDTSTRIATTAYVDTAVVGGGSGYVATPTYSDETCVVGQWSFDASFMYICEATNAWDRFPVTFASWDNPGADIRYLEDGTTTRTLEDGTIRRLEG